jgi:hypothetical protein
MILARLQISVRTMLVAVATMAALCAAVCDQSGFFMVASLGAIVLLPIVAFVPLVVRTKNRAKDWLWSKQGREWLTWGQCLVTMLVIGASASGHEPVSVGIMAALGLFGILAVAPILVFHDLGGRVRFSVLHCALVLALALCMLSVPLTQWPLRLAFAISRPALDDLAVRLSAGDYPEFPCRAGVFWIKSGQTNQGRPCLWTDPQSSGPTGFVKRTATAPNNWFNLWSDVALDADWRLVSED